MGNTCCNNNREQDLQAGILKNEHEAENFAQTNGRKKRSPKGNADNNASNRKLMTQKTPLSKFSSHLFLNPKTHFCNLLDFDSDRGPVIFAKVDRFPQLSDNIRRLLKNQGQLDFSKHKNQRAKEEGLKIVGPIKYNSGDYYWGQMKDGRREGYGKYILYERNSYYEGMMRDGKPDGYGVLVQGSGDCYVGMWKEGKAHGYGRFQSSDNVT